MKKIFVTLAVLLIICSLSVQAVNPQTDNDIKNLKIISTIKNDKSSPFYLDIKNYPKKLNGLPIGVFDSGTGGLTVLNSILTLDKFNNKTHKSGADGIPDFIQERFDYLGDSANMPYGKYNGEGKADFLRELILKDVQFLLSNKYYIAKDNILEKKTIKNPLK